MKFGFANENRPCHELWATSNNLLTTIDNLCTEDDDIGMYRNPKLQLSAIIEFHGFWIAEAA